MKRAKNLILLAKEDFPKIIANNTDVEKNDINDLSEEIISCIRDINNPEKQE